jgi:hypothetical protein
MLNSTILNSHPKGNGLPKEQTPLSAESDIGPIIKRSDFDLNEMLSTSSTRGTKPCRATFPSTSIPASVTLRHSIHRNAIERRMKSEGQLARGPVFGGVQDVETVDSPQPESDYVFNPHSIHPARRTGIPGPTTGTRTQRRGRNVCGDGNRAPAAYRSRLGEVPDSLDRDSRSAAGAPLAKHRCPVSGTRLRPATVQACEYWPPFSRVPGELTFDVARMRKWEESKGGVRSSTMPSFRADQVGFCVYPIAPLRPFQDLRHRTRWPRTAKSEINSSLHDWERRTQRRSIVE